MDAGRIRWNRGRCVGRGMFMTNPERIHGCAEKCSAGNRVRPLDMQEQKRTERCHAFRPFFAGPSGFLPDLAEPVLSVLSGRPGSVGFRRVASGRSVSSAPSSALSIRPFAVPLPFLCRLSAVFQPSLLCLSAVVLCLLLLSSAVVLFVSCRQPVPSSGSLLGFSTQAPSQAPSSQRLSIRARSRGMITSQE